MQVARIHQPGNRGPCFFRIPVPVRSPGLVRPVGAGRDHQRQQREGDGYGFVSNVVEGVGIGQHTFQIRAPPQQKQIQQRDEYASDERRENKGAGSEAGGEKSIRVKGGITSFARAQQEHNQRHDLKQNADEHGAVGDGQEGVIFFPASQSIQNQRRRDRSEERRVG